MNAETSQSDPLDCEIAAREVAINAKERDLEMMRLELKALKHAAALRPAQILSASASLHGNSSLSANATVHRAHRERGKPVGTISNKWRDILRRIVVNGNNFLTPEQWAIVSRECGYEITVVAVRDWLIRGGGQKGGYVERQGDAFRVSPLATAKFYLTTNQPTPDVVSDLLHEGEET